MISREDLEEKLCKCFGTPTTDPNVLRKNISNLGDIHTRILAMDIAKAIIKSTPEGKDEYDSYFPVVKEHYKVLFDNVRALIVLSPEESQKDITALFTECTAMFAGYKPETIQLYPKHVRKTVLLILNAILDVKEKKNPLFKEEK